MGAEADGNDGGVGLDKLPCKAVRRVYAGVWSYLE
jgi:hypothetical protein